MNNYTEAQQVLNSRSSRKLENNTYLKRIDENTIGVLLHDTFVVKYTPEYTELDSGGWRTATTKDRINKYSPAYVTQSNSIWYIGDFLYYDNIRVNNAGEIISERKLPEKTIKAVNKQKAQIKKFVDYCLKELEKTIPLPNGGDCWYCVLKSEEGETMGDFSHDVDHLKNHIKEKYVVPSMIVNSMLEAGYQKTGIGYLLSMDFDKQVMGGPNMSEWAVRNSLRKYLTKRLVGQLI